LDGTEAVSAGVRGAAIGPGSRVGSYLLTEQVGRGGMALVFLALDERLHRQVAIKVMAPGLPADEGFRQRFIRELRAAAAVDDPHIIPVFDAGEADGVHRDAACAGRGSAEHDSA
jgi:serine/threonine protein kinase